MRTDERDERREVVRRHVRQQRIIALVIGVGCLSFLLFYFVLIPALRGGEKQAASMPGAASSASPSPSSVGHTQAPSAVASQAAAPQASPEASPEASPTAGTVAVAAPRPRIVQKPITFGTERLKEMAAYSKRHYGDSSTVLEPKVIVLHYTAGGTWQSAWNLFESNQPNVNELPGTVAHFIIDKDGTIYQLMPLDLRGRHTIGLNDVALGIEFVEEGDGGDAAAVSHIFGRTRQIDAGLELVRWLQYRFGIPTKDVIGHGTANESPYFKDLEGWTNDHADWGSAQVRKFQRLLAGTATQ